MYWDFFYYKYQENDNQVVTSISTLAIVRIAPNTKMNFEAARDSMDSTGNNSRLFRILIIFGILIAVSIGVIVVFVAKGGHTHKESIIPQNLPKPDFFIPPTFLAK